MNRKSESGGYILTVMQYGCMIFLMCFLSLAYSAPGLGADSGSAESGAGTCVYVGTKKCKMCHIKQFKSWKETRMSQAFELLKPGVRAENKKSAGLDPNADYTTDKTCLPCHTTGYGQEGGFVSVEETPDRVGVGCEVCHGAGKGYLAKGFMTMKNKNFKRADVVAAGLVLPDASTCTGLCHNEKSPFFKPDVPFDWETRKAKGTHEHIPLKYEHE